MNAYAALVLQHRERAHSMDKVENRDTWKSKRKKSDYTMLMMMGGNLRKRMHGEAIIYYDFDIRFN